MKKLFTFVYTMAAALAVNAQTPDASKWTVGQDVTAEIGLGDCDGSFSGDKTLNGNGDYDVKSIGNYWKGSTPVEYHAPEEPYPGVIGFYNVGLVDIYQIVRIPAGSYTLKANSCYREGTPQDNFLNHFKGKKYKNGHMYIDILADDQTTVTRDFDRVVKSLAESEQNERIFFDADGSWKNDYEHKVKTEEIDADGNPVWKSYFCPCCLPGIARYFYEDIYANEKKFVLTEEAYVKIGFRKTASMPQDWLPFTNVKVIYNGEANNTEQLDCAIDEAVSSLEELDALIETLSEGGLDGLAGSIGDMKSIYESELSENGENLDKIIEIKNKIDASVVTFTYSMESINEVLKLLTSCDAILASTNFEGIEKFKSELAAIKEKANEADPDKIGSDPIAYYKNLVNELSKSRANYLNSQEPNEKGAKDFSSLITNPWFVNPEYTPSNDIANGGEYWHLTEATWADWGGTLKDCADYSNKLTTIPGITDICSQVDISSSSDVTNQWFKYIDHTDGWCSGTRLYYQSRLIGNSTTWARGFSKNDGTPGIEGIAQQLVGLPNGYYSVNCLAKGWDAESDWNKNIQFLGCFAENSKEVRVSSIPSQNINQWWEWNSTTTSWDDVSTSIVSVEDGKLLIGGGGSIANTVTGFRLFYYGETPDFSEMIQDKIAGIEGLIPEDLFAGDKKAVKDILATIAIPVASSEAYENSLLIIDQAKKRLDAAVNKLKEYTALADLNNIIEDFAEPAYEFFSKEAGKSESETYEKIDEYNAIGKAYTVYNEAYQTAMEFKSDPVVAAVLDKQITEMKAKMLPADVVNSYASKLLLPINITKMNELGATSGTAAAPASVSSFIVNPDFTNEPSKGWVGETPSNNEYSYDAKGDRINAELWNKSAFTLSQKIYGLPAGNYVLRVKAIYRDGGEVKADLVEKFNKAGSEEAWENHNAQLFARTSKDNEQFTYIKAIESLKYTETSFKTVMTEVSKDGADLVVAKIVTLLDPSEYTPIEECKYEKKNLGEYPFDTKVGDYFYPASMQGFYSVCQSHPEDVTNEVKITINNADVLEIGIRKTAAIGNDWVIFDDFELLYESGEELKNMVTGVDNIVVKSSNGAMFNLAGQRVNNDFKGVVIMNGQKVLNK